MAQTFTFEEALQGAPSPFDIALQAEGVTGKAADVARSIYQQESASGKNTKTSNAGAVGGMQIVPATFNSVADDGWDINDPVHNARAGIRYVQQMSDLAGGDPTLTAAGYYGGPGGLEKARNGVAVSDPRNPGAPNTLQYGQQVAQRIPKGAMAQAMDKVTDAIIPSANAQEVPPSNGRAAPVTFSFEEAMQPVPGQGAPAAAPKRSMIDELGHQLGLTLRAGVNGVASIPAMAADAVTGTINAGLDAAAGKGNGFRFQSAGQALNNAMTDMGVPQSENATERVVQDMASSVAGAGSLVGVGKGLAKAAGRVSQGVGELLAAGPGLQITSAATGAGASGITRESGGGAGAQMVAGLVGSAAPMGMAYAGKQPNGSKQLFDAATKAHGEGYVIPPADLNPGTLTEVASGLSGKIKTAQVASQRNQNVTNQLARKALGMAATDDLTTESLALIRKEAGQAYQAVAGAGTITPSASYATALDDAVKPFLSQAKSFPNRKLPTLVDDIQALKTGEFDAADAVEAIKVIRNQTDAAYRAGDKLGGKAYKQAAQALEDAIDEHLVKINAPADLLNGYREARKTIAKTYTVEKALNSQTGNVNAQKLAANLVKGRPLSGELKTIAEVGQAFPKATQALKEAPKQVSPLDVFAGAGAALTGSNPALLGSIAARPVVRSALLSGPVQRAAIKSAGVVNAGMQEGMPATALEAAARFKETVPPAPASNPTHFSFEEAMQDQDPAQREEDPPVRIELNGMAQPDRTEPATDPAQGPGAQDGPSPPGAVQGAVEIDPAYAFTSEPRLDGTLAIAGDAQALRGMLTAAGIPAHSIGGMKGGILVGRTQAARVQDAIERMHAAAAEPEVAADVAPVDDQSVGGNDLAPAEGRATPVSFESNQPPAPAEYAQVAMNLGANSMPDNAMTSLDSSGQGTQQDMQMAEASSTPVQEEKPANEAAAVMSAPNPAMARIQRLRDTGEHKVADILQRSHERNQTMGEVQSELASMQAASPDLPHHGNSAFNEHYQQRRLAGIKPAEASAYAGLMHAVQLAAPTIGMPDKAVKALVAKLQEVPIDEAPGFVERFTKALIKGGMIASFDGSEHIASALEHARDAAMHGALNGLYGDQTTST